MKYTFDDKDAYKEFFSKTIKFLKYAPICKSCNVHYGNFSSFVNGRSDYFSLDQCQIVMNEVLKINKEYKQLFDKLS